MDKLPPQSGIIFSLDEFEQLLQPRTAIAWLAVRAEDFLGMGGPSHHYLEKLSAQYPLSLLADGLSIGSAESVNETHLQNVKSLCERYQPSNVTTALSWNRWQGTYLGANMPLPLNLETLDQVTFNLRTVQNTLGRRVSVSNMARYVPLHSEQIPLGNFLEELVRQTGCGIVLDITHLYCAAINAQQDPFKLLQTLPLAAVREIHLCGQNMIRLSDDEVLTLADAKATISKPVWQLYREALSLLPGPIATLVKADPFGLKFEDIVAEAGKAYEIIQPANTVK